MSGVQSEIRQAGGCRWRLEVTVPFEEVSREFEETLRRYTRAIRIPGFRRGKVPPAIVKKRFAHEIEEEVRDQLVRQGLREAFERHEVSPLHNPVVDGSEVKEGEAYVFSALFEARPSVSLSEYRGLAVSRPEPAVTEEDVDGAIEAIREKLGKFVPVEPRPVAEGDFVLVDLEGHFEDAKGNDFTHQSVMIEVGSNDNLPEFDAALAGMQVGSSKTFTVSYPPSFEAEHLAGKEVRYTASLKEVKIKELPALDDELPKDLGKEGTLADLREDVRRDLLAARTRAVDRQAKESLLRQLIEAHPLEVPEVMVEEQLNHQIEDLVRGMILRGVHPSKTDIDWKELREKETPLARQRVVGMLILDEIAKKESIDVTEAEVDQRVREEARARGQKPEEVAGRLPDRGGRQALKNQLVREESLDFLLKNATIRT